MVNEQTTAPTLEEDFKMRTLDYINEKPVEAAPLNILIQRFTRKRAAKLSFSKLNIRNEIDHLKDVDAPEALDFLDKLWSVGKKILFLVGGIAVIVFMGYMMSDMVKDRHQKPKYGETEQEIPANHVNDKGAK